MREIEIYFLKDDISTKLFNVYNKLVVSSSLMSLCINALRISTVRGCCNTIITHINLRKHLPPQKLRELHVTYYTI